jgi:hypothetical protein
MKALTLSGLIGLAFSAQALALTPPPPLPRADLEAFYHATNGDQWLRNDGWLDEDTPICDWYGITCQPNPQWAFIEIARLELPNNRLNGEYDQAVQQMISRVRVRVDLSGNQLGGQLLGPLTGPREILLAYNQLEGPLPSSQGSPSQPPTGGIGPDLLQRLVLAGNRFSGSIPADWAQFQFSQLDLSDNQLDGGIVHAFAALRTQTPAELNLAGNRFSGELPEEALMAALWPTDLPLSGGGLNLCFNDLEIAEGIFSEWLDYHHVGGPGWQACLGRERVSVDPGLSGSWFAPHRSGEGISFMQLDQQTFLVYSFGFDFAGEQAWSFNVGRVGDQFLSAPHLLETRGDFSQGLRYDYRDKPLMRRLASLRLDRVGSERLHAERVMIDYSDCPPLEEEREEGDPVPLPCPVSPSSDRHDYVQLSRLAGTRCDQSHEFQAVSGAWFAPERSGEGFSVEMMANGEAVVYWYTYQPDGSGRQAWMIGQGPITVLPPITPVIGQQGGANVQIDMDNLLMPTGTRYGAEFDPDEIEYQDWGQLRVRIYGPDYDTGLVMWDSLIEGYGSGEYEIERLARPLLADCGED